MGILAEAMDYLEQHQNQAMVLKVEVPEFSLGLILEKLSKRMIGLLDAKIYLTDLLIDVWLMRQSTLTIPCLMTPHATRRIPSLKRS